MSLPTETIFIIIDQLHLTPFESVETALAVSSISRQWRAVAISTPSLWSTFSISLPTRHSTFFPTFLQRSASEPLDITVSFGLSCTTQSAEANVQDAETLLHLHAGRLQRLHLRVVMNMLFEPASDIFTTFIGFHSPALQHLEMEALQADEAQRSYFQARLLDLRSNDKCWSDRCPALTHITSTHPEFLLYSPASITYLCIKGVPGMRNAVYCASLYLILERTVNLVDLILDRVSLLSVQDTVYLPQLRSLSLCTSPLPDGSISPVDASSMASFLLSLDARALLSLAVPELNTAIPEQLEGSAVALPSVTRLAIVPCTNTEWWLAYSTALPEVEELVLLGADSELRDSARLPGDAWPHLRTIDLSELKLPPPENLQVFWERLYRYGRRWSEGGHHSRLLVRLPRGIVPRDLPLDCGEFMDLQPA